ncbi:MAG: sulfur oxidation c-type cytochrome SoxX [Ectothiorhodospiraceae bacterium]|nr:sulfur oxidation c-type cytochrome SoxX [Ectothiorhodospiraceae bacterium]MBN4053026.1 sulfur oxidation c-type cytochrome SoxX [Gammaproteobacteria bacterium AH-315-K14]
MRKTARNTLAATGALIIAMGSLSFTPNLASAAGASAIEEGKKIAFHRKKGNCLACHKIAGGSLEGNIGPALVNMKARYPDKAKLRVQIFDATVSNPNTIMPPFGKHKIISKSELDKVVEFIHSL